MKKPLQEVLRPEAKKKFEEYLEILIAEATFTWNFEPDLIYDEWVNECFHEFLFPDDILNNLENLLRPAKFLDRGDIDSICHGILDHMFWEHDVIKEKFGDDPRKIQDEGEPPKVKDYVSDKFRASVKQAMLDYFFSLPLEYVVLFRLPYVNLPTSIPIEISENIELLKIEKDLPIGNSPPCWSKLLEDGLLESPAPSELPEVSPRDDAHVLIKVQGTSLYTSINEMFQDAMRELKVLIAALYVSGILQEGWRNGWYPSVVCNIPASSLVTPVYEPLRLFRYEVESDWIMLPPAESDFMRTLRLNDSLMEIRPFEEKLIERQEGVDSSEVQIKKLEQLLTPIRKIFTTYRSHDQMTEVKRVRNALEWFFNGLLEKREPFSFIQLTVAAETLFGSKSHSDITDRLSDRCAYLIGENALDRNSIKKRFKDAYDIRSRILHEGNFNKDDKAYHSDIKELLQKALAKEINMIPSADLSSVSELSDCSQRQG